MNDKEQIIAEIRAAINYGIRPGSETLERWINLLKQDEQQTPPSPNGLGCAGESSVQPAALARLIECAARVVKRHDEKELAQTGDSMSIDLLKQAIQEIRRELQIEHEAKCHAAG